MSIEYMVSNILRWTQTPSNGFILGTKVHRRPAGRRQNQIAGNGNDFLLSQRLGHKLQEDHQPGQEVGLRVGVRQIQRQEARHLQGDVP